MLAQESLARRAVRAARCRRRSARARALPGSFVHLTCDPDVPMRRPLSIHARDAARRLDRDPLQDRRPGPARAGRPQGRRLDQRARADRPAVSCRDPKRPRALLVGGGVGIPPMVFLAEWMRATQPRQPWQPLVLMGSEIPFPFRARPSTILVPGMPAGSIACMPLLDGWGVPSRLASRRRDSRAATTASSRSSRTSGSARSTPPRRPKSKCSPAARRRCSRRWPRSRRSYGVPCQVSLEEFMACAVGGCAGCTVQRDHARRARDEARVRRRAGVRRPSGIRLTSALSWLFRDEIRNTLYRSARLPC